MIVVGGILDILRIKVIGNLYWKKSYVFLKLWIYKLGVWNLVVVGYNVLYCLYFFELWMVYVLIIFILGGK